jgi:hypothetical protein
MDQPDDDVPFAADAGKIRKIRQRLFITWLNNVGLI